MLNWNVGCWITLTITCKKDKQKCASRLSIQFIWMPIIQFKCWNTEKYIYEKMLVWMIRFNELLTDQVVIAYQPYNYRCFQMAEIMCVITTLSPKPLINVLHNEVNTHATRYLCRTIQHKLLIVSILWMSRTYVHLAEVYWVKHQPSSWQPGTLTIIESTLHSSMLKRIGTSTCDVMYAVPYHTLEFDRIDNDEHDKLAIVHEFDLTANRFEEHFSR